MIPVLSGWRISAPHLPERLKKKEQGFSLPGEEALRAFADLLGESDVPAAAEREDAPFPLPALIPEEAEGPVELTRTMDMDRLGPGDAELFFDMLSGHGSVYLDTINLIDFAPGALRLSLPKMLRRGQRTLRLVFDDSRPAGVCGPVMLHTTVFARLEQIRIRPDYPNMCADLTVFAREAGTYVLRALGICGGKAPVSWDTTLTLAEGERQSVSVSLDLPAPRFGTGGALPSLKFLLFKKLNCPMLCDSRTMLCGYPGTRAKFDLPLTPKECFMPPSELLARLSAVHCPAVCVPVPAPSLFYRAMSLAGIAVRQIAPKGSAIRERRDPCITFQDKPEPREKDSLILDAWKLCGLSAGTPIPPAGTSESELLLEAAGRSLDPSLEDVQDVLRWLRALRVRLRAEAARQGRLSGGICAPGAWDDPDIFAALQTTLAPLHLSALPLFGAWWTGSHFSASLHAFIPESAGTLRAEALLEDEQGNSLARLDCTCPAGGGSIGILEAPLPDKPCVLTLFTRLYDGDVLAEESQLPIYVGLRGILEAAFMR